MKQTLKTFHFSPEKSGQILKSWAKSAGLSYQRLADDTNYSYDTINNSLSGKIKDLSLERVFKISTRTGHSVCEYLRLMLQDEDIDFADDIQVLRDVDMELVPYTKTLVSDAETLVSDAKSCTDLVQTPPAELKTPESQALYQAMVAQAASTHQANLERFRSVHESYAKMLEDAHKKALEDQEKAHQEHIATVRRVARQRLRWIIILAVILLCVVVWFIWDLTHPELGLIRLKQMGYIGQMLIGKK